VQFFPGTAVLLHSLCEYKLQQFNSSHHPVDDHESFFHLHPATAVHVEEEVLLQQSAAKAKFNPPNNKINNAIKNNEYFFTIFFLKYILDYNI
jgi:hypothetical protein